MPTSVANIWKCGDGWKEKDDHVYIGRQKEHGACGLGNPYVLGTRDGQERRTILALYLAYLQREIGRNPSLSGRIHSLYSKTLVCHCKPERCHGDFLAHIADSLHDYEVKRGGKEWDDISTGAFYDRQCFLHQLVRDMTIAYGKEVRQELACLAQGAAPIEFGNKAEDGQVAFKRFRKQYLDPLLRWQIPDYRFPATQGEG